MNNIQRCFMPGDKWVYFKIYTGIKTADRILTKDISYIINQFNKKHFIDKWFFIRYNDPEFHLRIRILVTDSLYISEVLNLFHQRFNRLLKSGEIWKIQLDTYDRELERYTSSLIEEAESIFWIDSEITLSVLKSLVKFQNENYRWMISLRMIDDLLSDFSFDLFQKNELLKIMSNSFKAEFGFNEYNSKQFNSKFRENKKIIESILDNKINDTHFVSLYPLIKQKSKKTNQIISAIKGKFTQPDDSKILDSLLPSYIHMMLNRLFRSKARLHELIIYDFMYRYYTSKIAKAKYVEYPNQL